VDQYKDNHKWILGAQDYQLVVGSQARILYADQAGRSAIAVAINRAVAEKRLKAPVVISRDHHDVSGTDSPFRETSNIYDGSAFTADMAVQNCIGDSFRGATWVALHNGGKNKCALSPFDVKELYLINCFLRWRRLGRSGERGLRFTAGRK
jgi:urocanate hydratase